MKTLVLLLLTAVAAAQTASEASPAATTTSASTLTIPAGTRVPLSLKQAISTKTAREGDPVYAETTFPYVVNDHIGCRQNFDEGLGRNHPA